MKKRKIICLTMSAILVGIIVKKRMFEKKNVKHEDVLMLIGSGTKNVLIEIID